MRFKTAERIHLGVDVRFLRGIAGGPIFQGYSCAERYDANYGNFQTELYERVRREAFGEDIGQNSWLTADERDTFLISLALSSSKKLRPRPGRAAASKVDPLP